MSAQRPEQFSAIANVGWGRDETKQRPLIPYERDVSRPLMQQTRREYFVRRNAAIAANIRDPNVEIPKDWPGARKGALPRECINVENPHSAVASGIFRIACEMRDGKHSPEVLGRHSSIKCEKIGDGPHGPSVLLTVSDRQWVRILESKGIKASKRQVQLALVGLN